MGGGSFDTFLSIGETIFINVWWIWEEPSDRIVFDT
jgi:hypothetical protein